MDARSFDSFTRSLTTGLPRRGTIALVAGAVSSLLLGSGHGAEAGCKKVNKKCDKNNDCCDGAKCKKGKCECKNRFTKCGKKCYDLDKDEKHCGSCGNRCIGNELCIAGDCNDPFR